MWDRLAKVIVRRPFLVLALAAVVTVGLGAGLKGLEFRTSQDTLVSPSSQVYKDNANFQSQFGSESMLVLVTGDPVGLFSTANIAKLQQLEVDLRATKGVAAVVGPYGTMKYSLDQLAVAPQLLGAASARAEDPTGFAQRLQVETDRLAAAGEQSLTNPAFIRFLLFDASGSVRGAEQSAFPDAQHSLVLVRIAGNASIDEQSAVAHAVKDVVARYDFPGYTLLATGTPALTDEINSYLQGGMTSLALMALVVMIVVLGFAFRVRLRWLPLLIVAMGSAAALGAAMFLGIPLSLVTISGLPIFIGLGVDFAIQVHNRYDEQRREGDSPEQAAQVAISKMAPPLLVAMLAGAFGFLALRLSSVPMIRDFGLLLSLGVLLLVTAGIVVPATILMLSERGRARTKARRTSPALVERVIRRMTSLGRVTVLAVLAVGVVVAAAGFVVESRMPIETEAEHWVSPTGTAVKELQQMRSATGFSDELGILVQAKDVTSDDVVAWIYRFQTVEMQRHPGRLLQAASMPGVAADVVGIAPTGSDVRALLEIAPHDIGSILVNADHTMASIDFPVGYMPLAEESQMLDSIRADLRGDMAPPAGVTVAPAGLAVTGTELVKGMEANRRTLTLAALGFVALWLMVRGRMRPRALLPLVPVAMAVGVATFAVWALGFTLTPLTTVAAPLVIAVATEFTVLLEARYHEERHAGFTPAEACSRGLPRIGRAFVASGLTLIAGFGVMAASPMPLLRDFGVVVAIDVLIALVCALVIMPPLLRWTDRGEPDLSVPSPHDIIESAPERELVGVGRDV